MIQTTCYECIFAEWINNKQVGCKVNKLPKHANLTTTNDKQHYMIDGVCTHCRNSEWAKRINGSIIDQLYKEIMLKIDVIFINESENKKEIENNLIRVLEQLKQNKTQPCSITFSSIVPIDFNWYIGLITKHIGLHKYHVVRPILSQELWSVIDMCAERGKANYYLVFNLDSNMNLIKVLDVLNDSLNEQQLKFLMIKPIDDNYDGLVVQRYISRLLGDSVLYPISQKIEELNAEQKENMVLTWQE